ncbi:hydroxymyristoyl-ACP dehydratase [Pseudorhodoferax sp.]|uniref:hydroxymyristoyl-ACP dehydratase n=1 Tax=Pseudorhodoferax sp. TaxID=1993553 RepID=UPI002DD68A82|nr:hydroxymyristoyl-ACP dehydratase [Pseudorhodoferax sp.]
MTTPPVLLDHTALAARLPHQGTMCLLDAVLACDAGSITCRATGHHAADHPLRTPLGLLAPAGIEYAAQAMALHAALQAAGGAAAPRPGFLASVRGVRLHVTRLDDVPGALQVQATRRADDGRQASYQFTLQAEDGRLLLEGRATVVLDTPLSVPA